MKYLPICILLAATMPLPLCAAGNWTLQSVGGVKPAGRKGHQLVFVPPDQAYLHGGINEQGSFFDDFWLLSLSTKEWTELQPVGSAPSARHSHRLVYVPGTSSIYLFGGSIPGTKGVDDLWVWSTVSNTWSQPSIQGATPRGREEHTMVYTEDTNKIYIHGGYSPSLSHTRPWPYYLNDFHVLSLATHSW
jgi:N-acetylneuraminic acid mutarotase